MSRSVWRIMAVGALALAGCHTPARPVPAVPPASAPPPVPALLVNSPLPLEPSVGDLPLLDPTTATPAHLATTPGTYRTLTPDVCREQAAQHAPLTSLLAHENRLVGIDSDLCPAVTQLQQELRFHFQAEIRNRAAAQAMEQYYQMADAEARAEIVRASLPVLDQLRTTVKKAREEGLRVPIESEELDSQRASLLGLIGQADLAANLLDIDLKRRIGYPAAPAERLRPVGPFPVSDAPTNTEAAVQIALERRADLRLLRTLYLTLSPDTIPTAREILSKATETGGILGIDKSVSSVVPTSCLMKLMARRMPTGPDPALIAEVAVRREQLYDLIAERERQAADQVRAAAVTLDAQTRQVGLARWRAERLAAKVLDARKQGPLAELPATLEALRARADVVAAVMTWQQARIKLLAAQGMLESAPASETPPLPMGSP